MIDHFLNKNKKLIILCLLVLGIYMVSLYFGRNTELFCSQNDFNCFQNIEFGISQPISNLFPYFFGSILILFFVSDRLKRNAFISIIIASFPMLLWIFSFPVSCGSFFCDRIDSAHLTGFLYPIITILTLLISAICFYFKDKRAVKKVSDSA